MIKKLFFILLLMAVISISAMAKIVVQPSDLPQEALDFISKTFINDAIVYVERNRTDFEVTLQSGIELEFFINGEWKEIKSFTPITIDVLPKNVVNTLKQKYANASILEISKQYNSYEISLDNRREIYISNTGEFLGEKLD